VVRAVSRHGIDDLANDDESVQTLISDVFREVDIYDSDVAMLRTRFPSPLGRVAVDFYKFFLTDTVPDEEGPDSLVVLSFVPKNPAMQAFNGKIYVVKGDSSMFIRRAVLNVPSVANVNFLTRMTIDQEYRRAPHDGSRLKVKDEMTAEFNVLTQSVYGKRTTVYNSHSFTAPRDSSILDDPRPVIMLDDMRSKDSGYWARYRPVTLQRGEADMAGLLERLRRDPIYYWTERTLKLLVGGYVKVGGKDSKVDIGPTETATANTLKTYGLYYQWGRKDPLGRSANLANNNGLVTPYSGATGTTPYSLDDKKINIVDLLGEEDIEEKDGKPIDIWMLNYATANPTEFIIIPEGKYYNDWMGKINNYLWGNPLGYNNPRKSQLTHRSIFDPCPAGYRVAPRDLWMGFTKGSANYDTSVNYHEGNPETWAENNFNIMNRPWHANHRSTSLATQRGYFFCYEMNEDGSRKWQEGETDFYPTSGVRERTTAELLYVGTVGYSWSSSPYNATSATTGNIHFNSASVNPFTSNNRGRGFPVRCVKEK